MAQADSSNVGRWILGLQALLMFVIAGSLMWMRPEQACPLMAESRGVADALVQCPAYVGENPVFEMYTFSLAKHITMIGVVFTYFAAFGRSKQAIQAGLLYFPITLLVDWVPPLTWLREAGVSAELIPGIARLALASCALSGVGLWLNARHSEWEAGAAA
jgi:hypothetical protein